jgi:hypothetical protein
MTNEAAVIRNGIGGLAFGTGNIICQKVTLEHVVTGRAEERKVALSGEVTHPTTNVHFPFISTVTQCLHYRTHGFSLTCLMIKFSMCSVVALFQKPVRDFLRGNDTRERRNPSDISILPPIFE